MEIVDTMDASEGFYPSGSWDTYPEIEHCRSMVDHESHYWVPAFVTADEQVPDFICGGTPRRIHSIEEARSW